MGNEGRLLIYLFPSVLWLLQLLAGIVLHRNGAGIFIGVTAMSTALTSILRVLIYQMTSYNGVMQYVWPIVKGIAGVIFVIASTWWLWSMTSYLDESQLWATSRLFCNFFCSSVDHAVEIDGHPVFLPVYTVVSLALYGLAIGLSELREACGS